MSPVITIARYGIIEAIQGRMILVVGILVIVALMLALFVGEISLTETRQMQVALISGFLRLASVVTVMFFVVASVARDFQDKSIELLISSSIPRYQVFLGKWLGICLIVLLMTVLYALVLLFYSEPPAVFLWSFSLFCELSIVGLMSLVFILSLENIALSLAAVTGFYLLTRVMPVIQGIGDGQVKGGPGEQFMHTMMDLIDLVLPRLSEFSRSAWLVYNNATVSDLITIATESVLFILLFGLLGILDLKRKAI